MGEVILPHGYFMREAELGTTGKVVKETIINLREIIENMKLCNEELCEYSNFVASLIGMINASSPLAIPNYDIFITELILMKKLLTEKLTVVRDNSDVLERLQATQSLLRLNGFSLRKHD